MSGIDLKSAREGLSDLRDPFSKDCVIRFSTWCNKSTYGWKYRGTVEFRNGNTKGEQDFEAGDFSALLKKMETFIEGLNNA